MSTLYNIVRFRHENAVVQSGQPNFKVLRKDKALVTPVHVIGPK